MKPIPVNPHYVFEQPKIRGQYANPITLNNHLVAIANEYYELVNHIVKLNGRIAKLKNSLSDTEFALLEVEQNLLLEHPAPTADRKSNKLMETYVRRVVMEHPDAQTKRVWTEMRKEVRDLQADIVAAELERDSCFSRVGLLKVQSENIKTHLSYVKSEGRLG